VAEQRYQAVLAVISDGLSVSQVTEKVGVSRQTLHAPGVTPACEAESAPTAASGPSWMTCSARRSVPRV
jgi:hypothetical protein